MDGNQKQCESSVILCCISYYIILTIFSAIWDHSSVLLLFSLWKDFENLYKNDRIRNDVVWKKITESLNEKGYKYTVKQVENK